jgi:hypothetical protein
MIGINICAKRDIYMGTIGMEGAFEAMRTGEVDFQMGQGAPQPLA